MKTIVKIIDQIDEELEDAEKYIKCAMNYKDERPHLANMYYDLSVAEMGHFEKLHSAVSTLINEEKDEGNEPTNEMMAIYNYEHGKYIKEATEIRIMQEMFRH